MATVILEPTGDGATTEFTASAGENHFALVDEGAIPDTGDYVNGPGAATEMLSFPTPDIEGGTATAIKFLIYGKGIPTTKGVYIYYSIDEGSNWSAADDITFTLEAWYEAEWTELSIADLSQLQIKMVGIGLPSSVEVYTVRAEITYDAGAAGAFMVPVKYWGA